MKFRTIADNWTFKLGCLGIPDEDGAYTWTSAIVSVFPSDVGDTVVRTLSGQEYILGNTTNVASWMAFYKYSSRRLSS